MKVNPLALLLIVIATLSGGLLGSWLIGALVGCVVIAAVSLAA